MQEYLFDYSSYKKRIKKTNKFGFIDIFFLIIFLCSLCIVLKQTNTQTYNYYFVEISQFKNFSKANKLANEISQQAGAGFVYFDNSYHVLAGFYLNFSDAETVANNLTDDYKNAKVFSLSATKFKQSKNFSTTQNQALKNTISININLLNELYSISTNMNDQNNLNKNKLKLKKLCDDFNDNLNEFCKNFPNKELYNCKNRLQNIKNSLSRIDLASTQESIANIRYETINIAINHINFLNEIN